MKNFLFIAATILLDVIGGGFDRCSSEHYDDIYLNVSTNTVELDARSTEATFDVSSNSQWRALNADRWLYVWPKEGKNNGRISIAADKNESTADRSSSVRIICEDISIKVEVTQKGKEEGVK